MGLSQVNNQQGIKIMNFIYTETNSSSARGYNKTITVYRLVNNEPFFVGEDNKINTASWVGGKAIVSKIIAEYYPLEFTMLDDGYNLNETVNIFTL